MKKKLLIIGSTIGVLVLITGVLVLFYSQSVTKERKKKLTLQPTVSIEIGQTYGVSGTIIKLVNETHYVSFIDGTSIDPNEDESFPYVSFDEGTYHKEGETYIFDTQTSIRMEFLDKEHVKAKTYFEPKMSVSNIEEKLTERNICNKGFYKAGSNYKSTYGSGNVYVVDDMEIPNSMDEFLAQYHYEESDVYSGIEVN